MAYMLLIVEGPQDRRIAGREEGERRYARMLSYADGLRARGKLVSAESLLAQDSAVRVSRSGGEATAVDGPFAEAKEMIGGFFLLSVDNRDEAVAIANDCPAAEWATVEVRELGPCFMGSD